MDQAESMDTEETITDEESIILYFSEPEKGRATNTKVIQKSIDKGYRVIVVTNNFPSKILEKLYLKNGMNPEEVFFIDSVTSFAGGSSVKSDSNHIMVRSPQDLTGLSMAFSDALKKFKEDHIFILFDSLSTMLIYLPADKVVKFMHFITTKLRTLEESGAILAVKGGLDPMLYSQMGSLVDEIVDDG
ncbi:DUF7504 family protein [Methanoplanus endosymbiosus]|uniref:KaiC-like domain-containing protein n=1 Tax=Methanoplanus endosymbiosus TaxID=33865 RepID=A0A9E7PPP2_9EURY|nr:hypothetical protein [Methanoplanus endosymbiosus]UUX93760.1 hypothetical protein L6E24_06505 [Methanoplanus endosymbiosus]